MNRYTSAATITNQNNQKRHRFDGQEDSSSTIGNESPFCHVPDNSMSCDQLSRRNKRKAHHRHVHQVIISTNGRSIDDCIDFINHMMRQEQLTMHPKAVVGFYSSHNTANYLLELASPQEVDQVCYLNGIFFQNQPLLLRPISSSQSRTFSCWNEYHCQRYQRNDPVVDQTIHMYQLKWHGEATD